MKSSGYMRANHVTLVSNLLPPRSRYTLLPLQVSHGVVVQAVEHTRMAVSVALAYGDEALMHGSILNVANPVHPVHLTCAYLRFPLSERFSPLCAAAFTAADTTSPHPSPSFPEVHHSIPSHTLLGLSSSHLLCIAGSTVALMYGSTCVLSSTSSEKPREKPRRKL